MVKNKSFLNRAGFFLLILAIVLFSIFPFIQMLSTSLKYQWDWGNPSLIPTQINLEAYKELLNIGQAEVELPESVQNLINETPDITKAQKKSIIENFKDSSTSADS